MPRPERCPDAAHGFGISRFPVQISSLVIGALGLNPVQDLAEVPFFRFLTRGKFFERLEELGGDDATWFQVAHFDSPPAVIVIRIRVGAFERVAPKIEQFWRSQRHQRVSPDIKMFGPLFHVNQLPIVIADIRLGGIASGRTAMTKENFAPLNIGVIGLGRFERLHSLTLAGLAEAELVGLVARRQASMDAMSDGSS